MNYTWIIEQLWVKPTDASLTDVVVTAAWRCNGTDGTYSGTVYGTCSFTPPDPSSFIAYQDLTLAEVLNWCFASGVDQAACEANVATQIADQVNPPIITPPLPWQPPVIVVPPMLPQVTPVLVANDAPVADAPAA
jgi:hypothetical protein